MRLRATAIVLLLTFSIGCAAVPYEYGRAIESDKTFNLPRGESQVERGKPCWLLDAAGHYIFSLPSKLILWNWRVDNHDISTVTEEKLKQYLTENSLNNVKVRLNQQAALDEWRRLIANSEVGAGWRATLGTITLFFYTIIPGRLVGGDHYNPYTNTINLYSDHKAIALHEAAHAKDLARRKHKGTYAALRILPIVPLHQEGIATGDAIGYDKDKRLAEDEKADYKILYPAYGTYVAGEGLRWLGLPILWDYAIQLACAIPGHIIGRIKASNVESTPCGEVN